MTDHLFTWPPLRSGILIRRYKRFLADVLLEDGEIITIHCPNSGSMLGCSEPGRRVFFSRSENCNRKFPCTWEMIEMPGSLVVVNTLRANTLVKEAVERGMIPELTGYTNIRSEFPIGNHSRIDLLLNGGVDKPCLVEVKSSTLADDGIAKFPDAVTARGLKHLKELRNAVEAGYRSVMFFLIQRMDVLSFKPAYDIDPAYGKELKAVHSLGIEIIAYDTMISIPGINLGKRLPVIF
jgi:sugar fermentation stimulation protein A